MDYSNENTQNSIPKYAQDIITTEKSAFMNNLMEFLQNHQCNYSMKDLSEKLHIDYDTVRKYANGTNAPSYEMVLKTIRLCKSIDDSYAVDGLFGFQNVKIEHKIVVSQHTGLTDNSISEIEKHLSILKNENQNSDIRNQSGNYIKLLNWLIENNILLDLSNLLLEEYKLIGEDNKHYLSEDERIAINENESLIKKYKIEEKIRELINMINEYKFAIKRSIRQQKLIEDAYIYVMKQVKVDSKEGQEILAELKGKDK